MNKIISKCRGCFIISVLIAHCPIKSSYKLLNNIWSILGTIGVVGFFILSDFLFAYNKDSFNELIKKKIKNLVIPWFICSTVIFVITSILGENSNEMNFIDYIKFIFGYGSLYYFITVLISMFIVFYVIKKSNILLSVLLIITPINIMLSYLNIISIDNKYLDVLNWISFFTIGYILNKKNLHKYVIQLIKNNLFDLYFLDKNGFQLDKQKNNLKEDKVLNIDINEKIEDSRVITKDIFNKKVTMNDRGENEIVNLDKGWFKLDEQYYRYNIDFIIVIISLGATGITLLCVALKVARLLFELAFNKLFAILFAFADIDDGKKIREILKNILSIFAVLFATAIMVKLYIIFTTWIGSKMGNVEVGLGFSSENLAKILVQIGASIAVIDGPNIIEKVLGIDAGLRGGFGTVMSAYGVAKGLGLSRKTISSGAKLVGKAAGTSANIGAGMLGGIVGINKGKGSSLQEQDNLKNNSNIKDKNLQNEMNNYKSNSSSNIDNKNNDKENMNTKNKQNNSMINNNENDLSTLKAKNNKIADDFNDNKSLSLGNEIKDNNKSDIMENNNNKLNNINGYKGNSLNEQMKNQDNNNSLNSETNKQRESQPKTYDKNSLDYNNRYKGNSLDEEMKNNNNFKQPNKNS
ncbi:pLS20_p028 family conjugation system transmembrane protein, partial [Clostridium tarantellae]